MGHVLAGTESRATVRLVFIGGLVVTNTARLTADKERPFRFSVWHRAAVDMAVEALESAVHRMRDVIGEGRSVAAGLVTFGAGRAIDRLVLLILCCSDAGADQQTNDNSGGEEKISSTGHDAGQSSS
jgi:hypothetical protein